MPPSLYRVDRFVNGTSEIRIKPFNVTSVNVKDFAAKGTDGFVFKSMITHPLSGHLATLGLTQWWGQASILFGHVPFTGFLVIISFFSRMYL